MAAPQTCPRREVAFVVLLWVAIDLVGLGSRGLWNPVEPRYAGITSEMARGGSWMVPHYNGAVYDQKPPAYFWAAAPLVVAGGAEWELVAVRLPSALGGLAAMLGVLLLGRWWWGGSAGLVAAVALGCSWSVFWSGRFAHLDLPVTATLVWGVVALWGARTATGARRVGWVALGTLSLAAGILTKGPVAPGFVALMWTAWSLGAGVRGAARSIRRSGLLWMLAGATCLGLAWFLPAWHLAGDAWARELVLGQGVGRLLDASHLQKHDWLYYPTVLWCMAAPWGVLLPVALWAGWRRSKAAADRSSVALLTCWLVVVLAVVMLGETRRSRYLIPAMPAIALLIGRLVSVDVVADGWRAGRGFALAACVVATLPAAAAAGLLLAPEAIAVRIGRDEAAEVLQQLATASGRMVAGIALLALALASLVAIGRRRVTGGFCLATAALAATAVVWGILGAPAVDRQRGDSDLVAVLRKCCDEGRQPCVLGEFAERESALGFLGHHLRRLVEVVPEPGSPVLAAALRERPLVVIVREKDHAAFVPELRAAWQPVGAGPLGHDELWIYTNPWPPPSQGF